MEDFFHLYDHFSDPGKKVLATINRVTGSAYKREGAAMLFLEGERQVGTISAGCLEADLAHHAKIVMVNQETLTIQYDMREETDFAWGQGAGCNGNIELFLEPLTEQLYQDFTRLKKLLDANIEVMILKKLNANSEYAFIPRVGTPFGNWTGDIPFGFNQVASGVMENEAIFQHLYRPKPRLFIFGAGPDARPLASFAAQTGFAVTVCDFREAFLQKEHFPAANQLLYGFPEEIFQQITLEPTDFVVVMTHHFQRDQEILSSLLKRELKYVGILGPRDRTRRLLHGESIPIHLHSPVGMAIGAKGPEEIAVSIVAEMIQVQRLPVAERSEYLWTITD